MRFHQDFGVDQVPYQVDGVRVHFRSCGSVLFLRLSSDSPLSRSPVKFPYHSSYLSSSFQRGVSLFRAHQRRYSIQVGYAVASAVILFFFLSLTAFLGTSRTQSITRGDTSLSNLGSFFLGKPTGKGGVLTIFKNKSIKGNRRSFAFQSSSVLMQK